MTAECEVCKNEVVFTGQFIDVFKGCITDIGFVCKKCIRNWLADYLQMVNPFTHLKGEETFKIKRPEE
tara:strand:- start:229 stop:432 length:204 start_codon:yes stop_codon:yes gene_type:complete